MADHRSSSRKRDGRVSRRRRRLGLETLECRRLLSVGEIRLGPSDNIALDQPRVAVELAVDVDPHPLVEQWESVGPGIFNTFLLDTGANSIMAMATAVADLKEPPIVYQTEGSFVEIGVGGRHPMDISAEYRFDFAGTSGERNTLFNTRILSDPANDFSMFGPWGIVGMPAMADRVTTMDMRGWSGGGLGLDDLYMKVGFSDQLPADEAHRYALAVDNRVAFDPLEYLVSGAPPVWADLPFLTATPVQGGVGQAGNFLFDTGAQISLISEHLAIAIGLDSNGDGLLNADDAAYLGSETIGGVGGQATVPIFAIDELRVPVKDVSTGAEVELVWTDLQWLVLDIDAAEGQPPLDGVFGCDLLTSGWFYAFFYPGMPDGYIDQVHLDFRGWTISSDAPEARTGTVYFDLNPTVDQITLPGPSVRIQESARSTEVVRGITTDTYTIALATLPAAPVMVTVTTDGVTRISGDGGATYSTSLDVVLEGTFPQIITVAADQAGLGSGPQVSVITHTVTSADQDYDGIAVQDVNVRVLDYRRLLELTADAAGEVPLTSIDVAEGGGDAYYYIRLSEAASSEVWVLIEDPTGQVLPLNPNNTMEGFENVWQFSAANWGQPQPVRLTAVDDAVPEGPHSAQLVHTVLDLGAPLDPIVGQDFLTVNVADNDQGGVTVTRSADIVEVDEEGRVATYQMQLDQHPSGPVEVTVTADTQVEVSVDGGASFATTAVLTFLDTFPRTITVRAVDDEVDEGTHIGRITHHVTGSVTDPRFPWALAIDPVIATITDNDTAGLAITEDAAGQHPLPAIDVVEHSAGVVYWVALTSQPKHDVKIVLDPADTFLWAVDEAHPEKAYLEFTPVNWAVPQAIRVTAPDNGIPHDSRTVHLAHRLWSADPTYQGTSLVPVRIADTATEFTLALSASATTVARPGQLTLTATVVAGGSAEVRRVQFYRDSDRNGSWSEGVDQLWSEDTDGSDGWSLRLETETLSPATHMFFARAEDAAGRWTAAAGVTFEIIDGGLIDTDVPVAAVDVLPIETAGAASHQFQVTLRDAIAVDVATLGTGDLWVRGPAGYQRSARLISVDQPANGTPRTATFEVLAPGDVWDADASGLYEIWMAPLAISDVSGRSVGMGRLGTFAVTIDPTQTIEVPAEPSAVASDDRFVVVDGQLQLRPGRNLIGSAEPTLTFVVSVPDVSSTAPPNPLEFTVTVWTCPWQNPTEPRDVNRDGSISSRDALHIINRLNAQQGGMLPLLPADATADGFLLDVNGDHYLSPHDALLVINWLNRQPNVAGEGERTAWDECGSPLPALPAALAGELDSGTPAAGSGSAQAAADAVAARGSGAWLEPSANVSTWWGRGSLVSPTHRPARTARADRKLEASAPADWLDLLAEDVAAAGSRKR